MNSCIGTVNGNTNFLEKYIQKPALIHRNDWYFQRNMLKKAYESHRPISLF